MHSTLPCPRRWLSSYGYNLRSLIDWATVIPVGRSGTLRELFEWQYMVVEPRSSYVGD